jgi:hypothetical protein
MEIDRLQLLNRVRKKSERAEATDYWQLHRSESADYDDREWRRFLRGGRAQVTSIALLGISHG